MTLPYVTLASSEEKPEEATQNVVVHTNARLIIVPQI
jgi:hypothetical protein